MNFTDPESRIMVTGKKSFDQCYNAQAAVDAEERLIVATHLSANTSDSTVLVEMTQRVTRNLGRKPMRVLADSGYRSEVNFVEMEKRKIDAYIALTRGEPAPGDVNPSRPATRRMARKLATRRGRARYKRRKDIVEPLFGWAKQALGFRGFLMRGLKKVQGEWNLVCAALNLRRMKVAMA